MGSSPNTLSSITSISLNDTSNVLKLYVLINHSCFTTFNLLPHSNKFCSFPRLMNAEGDTVRMLDPCRSKVMRLAANLSKLYLREQTTRLGSTSTLIVINFHRQSFIYYSHISLNACLLLRELHQQTSSLPNKLNFNLNIYFVVGNSSMISSYLGTSVILESEISMYVLLIFAISNTIKLVTSVQKNVTLLSRVSIMVWQLIGSAMTFANRLKMKSVFSRCFMIRVRQKPTLNTSV